MTSANVCCLGQGTSVGWTSPTLPKLLSDSTPFDEPVSAEMAAWIGAVLPLGAIAGTLLFGTLSNFIGSKHSLLLCALPVSVSARCGGTRLRNEEKVIFLFFYYADTLDDAVLGQRCGDGDFCSIHKWTNRRWSFHLHSLVYCGNSQRTVRIFYFRQDRSCNNKNICFYSVRGQLSSLMQVSFNCGIALGFVACSYLDFYTVPLVLIMSPLTFFSVFIWLPSTPQMLLKQNQSKVLFYYILFQSFLLNSQAVLDMCRKPNDRCDFIAISN